MDRARQLNNFIKHATRSELLRKFNSVKARVMSLPVCPRCERICLRDKRKGDPPGQLYITCPICGYHGPTTMAVRTFIKEHVLN